MYITRFLSQFQLLKRVISKSILSFLTRSLYFRPTSLLETGRGAVARGVTAKLTGCGFDPHSRR